jgi:hypothetical protein
LNSLKDIWSQFQKFIRLNQDVFIRFSNDRYESGNSLIVVLVSLLSIYVPFILNSSSTNISDIVFYGLVDGVFAWLLATLASWFLLTRAFNTIIEITNLLIFTGYTHGLLCIFGVIIFINNYFSIPQNIFQLLTLLIFGWMYFVLAKALAAAFLLEKRTSSIASVTFLAILIFFSDPIRIFV